MLDCQLLNYKKDVFGCVYFLDNPSVGRQVDSPYGQSVKLVRLLRPKVALQKGTQFLALRGQNALPFALCSRYPKGYLSIKFDFC